MYMKMCTMYLYFVFVLTFSMHLVYVPTVSLSTSVGVCHYSRCVYLQLVYVVIVSV